MKKILWFFVILALSTFGLHLQAMEQSIENDTVGCNWATLPQEIKLHIISFLPAHVDKIKDFFDYALVNTDFASLIPECAFSEIKNYKFAGEEKVTILDIFFKAAQKGRYKVVKTLIERAVDVNAKNSSYFNYTALQWAARNGHIEVAKLLIDHGANINPTDNHVNTGLILAAREGHTQMLQLFLECGAHVDAQGPGGITALIWATLMEHLEIVKLLIASGANIDAENNQGQTALMLAGENGYTEIVELLKNAYQKN